MPRGFVQTGVQHQKVLRRRRQVLGVAFFFALHLRFEGALLATLVKVLHSIPHGAEVALLLLHDGGLWE